MRDSRKPTPTIAGRESARADAAARLAAGQLREARRESGLSQQALAEAMWAYGFLWRQTTVAKSEAADRPILFTEMVALAALLGKPVEYFFEAPDAIAQAVEEADRSVERALAKLHRAQADMASASFQLAHEECIQGLAVAARSYRSSYDSGVLRHDLDRLYELHGGRLAEYNHAYKAVPVLRHELDLIDREALREVADGYLRAASSLTQEEVEGEGAALLLAADEFLKTDKTDPAALDALRSVNRWGDIFCFKLVEIFVERIEQ